MSERLPDLYLVIWNGVWLELDSTDAIAFSEAHAQALVGASPGRRESYSVERRAFATLVTSPEFAPFADLLRQRIKTGDLSPMMLRDDAEPQRRAD